MKKRLILDRLNANRRGMSDQDSSERNRASDNPGAGAPAEVRADAATDPVRVTPSTNGHGLLAAAAVRIGDPCRQPARHNTRRTLFNTMISIGE